MMAMTGFDQSRLAKSRPRIGQRPPFDYDAGPRGVLDERCVMPARLRLAAGQES
jgi:hypothetical protein